MKDWSTNKLPASAAAVETAVPVFIGYTQTAGGNGEPLAGKPTRIGSFAEYVENFGVGFQPVFTADTSGNLSINTGNAAYLFNSIRLFYANGGSDCYILSVGTYGAAGISIDTTDFIGSPANPVSVFDLLEKEFEPTIVVIPDIIALGKDAYQSVYASALAHCAKEGIRNRVCILDLRQPAHPEKTTDVIREFRKDIGLHFLDYGAAYYPWLKTSVVQPGEVTFENLDPSTDLGALLPEAGAKAIAADFKPALAADAPFKKGFHQSLMAVSPTYGRLMEGIRCEINVLPPSGAIAGIYSRVDHSRGVWEAPAGVCLQMVDAPAVHISNTEQDFITADPVSGKSINVIRFFSGSGPLVWGARTLDGNSRDWRYINVRRTIIMIEQSLRLVTRTYVFEPNVTNTWNMVKAVIVHFLTHLWKQGGLAGAIPEQAFDVQIGPDVPMTHSDIPEGTMNVTVKVAVSHPGQFIVISIRQQQQRSGLPARIAARAL